MSTDRENVLNRKKSDIKRISIPLLLTLALLSGIAPFATDMYLPAFPEMVTDLATTATGVQLSLTTFLIGAGVGQLIFGPLSDRVGRVRPLLVGMGIYLVSSLAAAFSPTIAVLLVARLIQGLSAASGMVISRAIVTDMARGTEAARALSIVMLVSGISPVIAPVAGSLLASPLGWRGLLATVAGLVAVGLVASVVFVKETKFTDTVPTSAEASINQTSLRKRELFSRQYLGNMLAYVFAFTTMMAYISASPFLYENMMGLDAVQYGLMFGFNAFVLMVVGGLSARLTRSFSITSLSRVGLFLNLLSIVGFVILVAVDVPTIWLALPITFMVGSLGLVFGNTTALALNAVPSATGLGSAVLGLLQHVLAGGVAPLISLGGQHTAWPLAIVMLVATMLANLAFAAAAGFKRQG